MRIFKNAWFERFARKQGLTDKALLEAIERAEQGLIDADLGSGVIKQRMARPAQGKSGGFRTIVLYHTAKRAFFVYGFSPKAIAPTSMKVKKLRSRNRRATCWRCRKNTWRI